MIGMRRNKGKKAGEYGYIDERKKRQTAMLFLWVFLIAVILIAGYIRTGTRLNEATVVGVILVLPAAKTLIRLILLLPYRSGDKEKYEQVKAALKDRGLLYSDLVLTRYEGSMSIYFAVIHGSNVFAFVPSQKCSPDKIKEYLAVSVKSTGSNSSPMVCTEFEKFMGFVKKIGESETKTTKNDQKIASDILSRAV